MLNNELQAETAADCSTQPIEQRPARITPSPLLAAYPSPYRGCGILSFWTNNIDSFLTRKKTKTQEKILFKTIFKDDAEHLFGKKWKEDFGGFFLNLDNKNQVAFLNEMSSGRIDLTFPDIPDWENIGAKFGMKDWDEYTQEDVRTCAVGFKELSEWNCYPHDLVWLRKFVLYAENNSIRNEGYQLQENFDEARLFGCYKNWSYFYNWLSIPAQTELCKQLVSYA